MWLKYIYDYEYVNVDSVSFVSEEVRKRMIDLNWKHLWFGVIGYDLGLYGNLQQTFIDIKWGTSQ